MVRQVAILLASDNILSMRFIVISTRVQQPPMSRNYRKCMKAQELGTTLDWNLAP
jgi:hypothetical protein